MSAISLFEEKQVRRAWNTTEEKWVFSINDIVQALTGTINVKDYIKKLRKRDPELDSYWETNCPLVEMGAPHGKKRLSYQGNETVTNCHGLKMTATAGNQRLTDVANTAQHFRLIQPIPSHNAEPFKRWLANVGYKRLEEIEKTELATKRTRAIYQQKGYSEEWFEKRLCGIVGRGLLTYQPASPAQSPPPRTGARSAVRPAKFQKSCGSHPPTPPPCLRTRHRAYKRTLRFPSSTQQSGPPRSSLPKQSPNQEFPRSVAWQEATFTALIWQVPTRPRPGEPGRGNWEASALPPVHHSTSMEPAGTCGRATNGKFSIFTITRRASPKIPLPTTRKEISHSAASPLPVA